MSGSSSGLETVSPDVFEMTVEWSSNLVACQSGVADG